MNDFLKTPEGQEMVGPTGGIQGLIGTLFGKPYEAGSWQDKLIETFSGTHDFIGGSLSGLYDENGNIKRGMTDTERAIYNNLITTSAIPVAAPFAAAELLPPEVWQAISILLEINGVSVKINGVSVNRLLTWAMKHQSIKSDPDRSLFYRS